MNLALSPHRGRHRHAEALRSFTAASIIACAMCAALSLILCMSVEAKLQEKSDFAEILKVAAASAPLTSEERGLAVRLADQRLRSDGLLPERRTFLTLVQTYRNGESEKKGMLERHALLTYYRYEGDLGILVYVNLARQKVTAVEQLQHFPAPLAPEEFRRAKELAFNHPQLKKVFEPFRDRVLVEPILTSSSSAKDRFFGHRVVLLLFRLGPYYLTAQGAVTVDLTTETVFLSPVKDRESDGGRH